MTIIARVLALLTLLALSPAPAQAEPPLRLFAGVYPSGEVVSGGTFEVVLSAYSTSPAPIALELNAPTPTGMTLRSTAWNTDTIAFDKPVTILLRYSVQMPNDGHYETLGYTVKDGQGHLAARWIVVRVGSVVWPPAQLPQKTFLAYVRKMD